MLVRVNGDYQGKGFQVVGIALDDVQQARDFASELGVDYTILVGSTDVMAMVSLYGNRSGVLRLESETFEFTRHVGVGPPLPVSLAAEQRCCRRPRVMLAQATPRDSLYRMIVGRLRSILPGNR